MSDGFEIGVEVVEYLGTETMIVGALLAEPETRVTAILPGRTGGRDIQRLRLSIQPGALHVFDAQSGRSILTASN